MAVEVFGDPMNSGVEIDLHTLLSSLLAASGSPCVQSSSAVAASSRTAVHRAHIGSTAVLLRSSHIESCVHDKKSMRWLRVVVFLASGKIKPRPPWYLVPNRLVNREVVVARYEYCRQLGLPAIWIFLFL